MEFLHRYLRSRLPAVCLFLFCCVFFAVTFALLHLPLRAVLYPSVVSALALAVFLACDCAAQLRRYRRLKLLEAHLQTITDELPEPETATEASYQHLIRLLSDQSTALDASIQARVSQMMDDCTLWAHQIKTPIAAIRLRQQQEDSDFSRSVAEELQRIEQYVDMVMAYLRLDSDSTDYVFRTVRLDDVIRPAVRKYSPQFIRRRISLIYTPIEATALTDEKWLGYVVEQILSNALKYTPHGSIEIGLESPKTLFVRDTGIGIAPEDLPRVFEKGYTGCNGRTDKRATGIGLYLCRKICANLGHTIRADSTPGRGTTIRIDLEKHSSNPE